MRFKVSYLPTANFGFSFTPKFGFITGCKLSSIESLSGVSFLSSLTVELADTSLSTSSIFSNESSSSFFSLSLGLNSPRSGTISQPPPPEVSTDIDSVETSGGGGGLTGRSRFCELTVYIIKSHPAMGYYLIQVDICDLRFLTLLRKF